MAGLCRFCAKNDSGVDVFSEEGQKENLYSKIKLCLPINMTVNDGMTTHICFSCIKKLNISYEFHTTSVSVQYQLRNVMETIEKAKTIVNKNNIDIPQKYPEKTVNIINQHINQNESSEDNNISNKTASDCCFKIEAVQSISQMVFQNLSSPEENNKNGKRVLDSSGEESPDITKKKERMTVCQYCRKWFPRSIIIHHEKLHVKGSMAFNCTLCNKDFQEAEDFKNHSCSGEED